MKVAIIGARGLVGKEFTRQLCHRHQVLPLTRGDLEITDARAVKRLLQDERPSLIINCAVLGVDACELEPSLAWAVNVTGAETLARTAAAIDADFVQISTNYVFGGKQKGDEFYIPEDVAAPRNVYGRTKLAGEQAVRAVAHKCYIVRSSWIFGNGKDNYFGTAPRLLNAGTRIRAITDVWANATYVRDLVLRVIEILSCGHYSIYHVVNEGLCSYYDFALEAARILGISNDGLSSLIEPVPLSEFRHRAERPRYTPMRCLTSEKLGLPGLRDWRIALAEYIHEGGVL